MVRGFRQRASNMCGIILLDASCSAIAADNKPEIPGWRQQTEHILLAKAAKFKDEGKTNLLLSGYAHHGRNTYTPERIREFNENAWGLIIAWDGLPFPGAMEKFCTKNMFLTKLTQNQVAQHYRAYTTEKDLHHAVFSALRVFRGQVHNISYHYLLSAITSAAKKLIIAVTWTDCALHHY